MNMHIYAQDDRVNAQRGLTDEEIFKKAPAIFATNAHESRSERFAPIPTIHVIQALRDEGFYPVHVTQSRTRDEAKRAYTKHLIRLRRIGTDLKVDDTFAEVVLKNANDGTSAYDLMAGLWRVRCKNGMVAQTSTIDVIKVRHSGDAVNKVIEGTYRVLQQAETLLTAPQDWSQISLSPEERFALAEAAHLVRFGDQDGNVDTPIKPTQLLAPRRPSDTSNDLWTTFNVIQENVIRGGLSARLPSKINDKGQNIPGRVVTTRQIGGIDQDVKLNKALWVLTERLASVYKAAA